MSIYSQQQELTEKYNLSQMIKDDVTQNDQIITQVKFGEYILIFILSKKSKEWPLSIKVIIQSKGMEFCSRKFSISLRFHFTLEPVLCAPVL
jgi:hypothetical protein